MPSDMTSKKSRQDDIPVVPTYNVDIDMVVKVLQRSVFSPVFTLLIPMFFFFYAQGAITPAVIYSACYCAATYAISFYRNHGHLFFAPKPLDWGEQIVLITGGSSGMGELLANTLAARNVNVVVLDIKPAQTEIHNIKYYKCDVSNWEEVKAVSEKVIEEVGHPTILVNNAGVVQGKLILDLEPEDISQTFGVNTFAHFWTLKAFLPKMIERQSGHIVTLASVMGYVGSARMSDYSASKAALLNMHESLRYELDKWYLAPRVRTTLVCPGHVCTPLFSTAVFPDNAFYRFFIPSLAPVTVVKAIMAALDSQQSQTILLPFYANSGLIMKLLPRFLRDFAQKLTHADFILKDFTKVTAIREDERVSLQSKKAN